jgi:dienelactone hydrolase
MIARMLLLLASLALGNSAEASGGTSRLMLPLQSGRELEVHLLVPPQASGEARRPAVMVFGGFEYGAQALERVKTSRDTVLASFDYPFVLPEHVDGTLGALRLLPEARRAIRDTLDGIARLQAYLLSRPDVDPSRVTLVGVSFGSPFAVVAAQRNGTPGLAVIHGFGSVSDVVAHVLARRWDVDRRPWAGIAASLAARVLVLGAGVPDVEHHAARLGAEQRVLMLAAQGDERVPSRATQALREAFEASSATLEFEQEPGGHLRGGDDPRIPSLLRRAERWMRDAGLQ